MGNILRLFRRRKLPSQELDELVLQIRDLESQLKQLLEYRAWTLRCLIYCAFFMLSTSCAYFWMLHSSNIRRKFLSCSSSIIACTLAFLVFRFSIKTIFDWLVRRKQRRLRFFTERKVAIIEDVKENEKFKVAKEIIEKYGSQTEVTEWLGPSSSSKVAENIAENSRQKPVSSQEQQQNRQQLTLANGTGKSFVGNGGNKSLQRHQSKTMQQQQTLPKLYEIRDPRHVVQRSTTLDGKTTSRRAPVRPFMEESRGGFDRLLDFVMGESINNRYALICANCYTHNGMALREEFETISYCCYRCNFFNASKVNNEMNKKSPLPARSNIHSMHSPNYSGSINDFSGHTDESTENEFECEERKCSTINAGEASEREEDTLLPIERVSECLDKTTTNHK